MLKLYHLLKNRGFISECSEFLDLIAYNTASFIYNFIFYSLEWKDRSKFGMVSSPVGSTTTFELTRILSSLDPKNNKSRVRSI